MMGMKMKFKKKKKNVINKLNSTTELNTEYGSKENKPNRRNKIKNTGPKILN